MGNRSPGHVVVIAPNTEISPHPSVFGRVLFFAALALFHKICYTIG